jgi:hypothetical protein
MGLGADERKFAAGEIASGDEAFGAASEAGRDDTKAARLHLAAKNAYTLKRH